MSQELPETPQEQPKIDMRFNPGEHPPAYQGDVRDVVIRDPNPQMPETTNEFCIGFTWEGEDPDDAYNPDMWQFEEANYYPWDKFPDREKFDPDSDMTSYTQEELDAILAEHGTSASALLQDYLDRLKAAEEQRKNAP